MNRAFQRMKDVFKREPHPQPVPPPGSYPTNFGGERKQQPFDTVTKPSIASDEEDDDIEEELTTSGVYNIRQQTQVREQKRDTIQSGGTNNNTNPYGSGESPRSTPVNRPESNFRTNSGGFVPNTAANNNTTSMNARSTPISQTGPSFLAQIRDPSSRPPLNPVPPLNNASQPTSSGFPTGPNNTQPSTPGSNRTVASAIAGFPPGLNNNQPATPGSNRTASSAIPGFPPGLNTSSPAAPIPVGVPPGLNANPPAAPNNGRPPLAGYPPSLHASQSTLLPPTSNAPVSFAGFPPANNNNPPGNLPQPYAAGSYSGGSLNAPPAMPMNNANNSYNGRMTSFRSQSNRNNEDSQSRLELEYPIENVLIDANIPSAMAIKVNDAVERDRLGNNHIIRRYTFDPPTQHMSFQNRSDPFGDRRTENSRHVGMRHIREISSDGGTSILDDIELPRRRAHRHRYHESSMSVDRYVDELLQSPGRTVYHVDNSNALQQILAQTLAPSQIVLTQPAIFPAQSTVNSLHEPINYYTARALPYDPMRIL